MSDTDDHRVASTTELMLIVTDARLLGLNRQLAHDVGPMLDPDGFHVLSMVLPDHHADPSRRLPTHHRVAILAKLTGSSVPYQQLIDVLDVHWDCLMTMEQWREAQAVAEADTLRKLQAEHLARRALGDGPRGNDEAGVLLALDAVLHESHRRVFKNLPESEPWT